jgi:hypothetical protein
VCVFFQWDGVSSENIVCLGSFVVIGVYILVFLLSMNDVACWKIGSIIGRLCPRLVIL